MEFDLSKYELEDTSVLIVQNASNDGDLIGADGVNPVKITLYGSGTEQAVAAGHKAQNAMTARMKEGLRGKITKNDSQLSDVEQAQRLAACTASIENFPVDPLALYKNPKLGYIRNQVMRWQGEDANFAKGSATS